MRQTPAGIANFLVGVEKGGIVKHVWKHKWNLSFFSPLKKCDHLFAITVLLCVCVCGKWNLSSLGNCYNSTLKIPGSYHSLDALHECRDSLTTAARNDDRCQPKGQHMQGENFTPALFHVLGLALRQDLEWAAVLEWAWSGHSGYNSVCLLWGSNSLWILTKDESWRVSF